VTRRNVLIGAAAAAAAAMLPGSDSRGADPERESPAPGPLMRSIGSDGEKVHAVGMGTWQTFNVPPERQPSLAPLELVLHTFYQRGGRVIDSSPMYGHSQEVVGKLSRKLAINEDLFLATKVWTAANAQTGAEQMEQSIKELGRESGKLDLMQVHNLLNWREHLETLHDWKEQERLRYIGVTHYQQSAYAEVERIMQRERIDFVQVPYSVDVRSIERRLLPIAADTGTSVLIMRPFGGGDLLQRVKDVELPDFARAFADSWAQALLKWILADPRITCVLPATRQPAHMSDNMGAAVGRLPDPDEREQLAATFASLR
jgi:diketogulonate reductase-like aldo/keto reductase